MAAKASLSVPAPAPEQLPRRTETASLLFVAALATVCYLPTLTYGLVWDDPISVHRWLPALRSLRDFFWPPPAIPQFPPDYYRPLQLLSYRLDFLLGGGAPWAFHLTSLLFHVACTLLFQVVTRRLFSATDPDGLASLFASSLFAAHPIHSESVAWMAARPDVMVTTFGLAAVLTTLQQASAARLEWGVLFLLAALLSKENAVAFCLLLPLAAFLFAPSERKVHQRRLASGAASAWRAWTAGCALALAVYGSMRWVGLAHYEAPPWSLARVSLPSLLGVLGFYWKKLIWPPPQTAYVARVPDDWFHLALGAVGLLAILASLRVAWTRGYRIVVFACAWILSTVGPSLAVLLRPDVAPVAERYAYLPSAGFCWLLAWVFATCRRRGAHLRISTAAVAGLIVVLATAGTLLRIPVWKDNVALWSDAARKESHDGFALRNLGAALLERGELEPAKRVLLLALERQNSSNGLFLIYNNLATIHMQREEWDSAREFYEKAYAVVPGADALYNLGVWAWTRRERLPAGHPERQRLAEEALERFLRASEASPWDPDIHVALGQCWEVLGDPGRAEAHYTRSLQLGLSGQRATQVRRALEELRQKKRRDR